MHRGPRVLFPPQGLRVNTFLVCPLSYCIQGGDAISTGAACVAIVKLCYSRGDLKALNANALVLSKRRGQLKAAITELLREATSYIDLIPAQEDKLELITTLRTITEGKVRVLSSPTLGRSSLALSLSGLLFHATRRC